MIIYNTFNVHIQYLHIHITFIICTLYIHVQYSMKTLPIFELEIISGIGDTYQHHRVSACSLTVGKFGEGNFAFLNAEFPQLCHISFIKLRIRSQ